MIFEILSAVLALTLALYVILVILQKKKLDVIKGQTVSLLKHFGHIVIKDKKILFTTQRRSYQILFFFVATNAELTINSRTMWEIINSGTSQVIDQSIFLSSEHSKLVIIYPSTSAIKRFINENEMVFIKSQDHFYDMHVIRNFELESLLSEDVL
ncbi:MAG: hypothetical protein KKG64_03030 [Firmicutes bacterium]|nr:hypothetical protein [Bacillota bacterium]